MKRMKRWMSALLTVCMLMVMLPAPVLSEEEMPSVASEAATVSAQPTATATPMPATAPTATPTSTPAATNGGETQPASTATTGTEAQPTPTPTATGGVEATATPTVANGTEATATPVATSGAEATATAAPTPTPTATGGTEAMPTATPTSTPGTEATPTASVEIQPTGTPQATSTPGAEVTPTATPTAAPEIQTIVSFIDAVTPEGIQVTQGTPVESIGLPANIQVQFADGGAGNAAVTWQCETYDPDAEIGAEFTFTAVFSEGYALAEGLAAPTAKVTIVPPASNAIMPMSAIEGNGWSLSEDGVLTINAPVLLTGNMIDGVNKIVVANGGSITGMADNVTVFLDVQVEVQSGGRIESGTFDTELINYGQITGGTFKAEVNNCGEISGGTFVALLSNAGQITGGSFNDVFNEMNNRISGGTFNRLVSGMGSFGVNCVFGANADTKNFRGEIQRSITANGKTFTVNYKDGIAQKLNEAMNLPGVTWQAVDSEGNATPVDDVAQFTIHPASSYRSTPYYVEGGKLYIDGQTAITAEIVKAAGDVSEIVVLAGGEIAGTPAGFMVENGITVQSGGKISGGAFESMVENSGEIVAATTSAPIFYEQVTNNGAISGGVFQSSVTNNGTISGSGGSSIFSFSDTVTNNSGGEISGGNFSGHVENLDIISGGSFSGSVVNGVTISGGSFSGDVTNNGTIEAGSGDQPTFVVNGNNSVSNDGYITGGTFQAPVHNLEEATITGGSFSGEVTNDADAEIRGGSFSGEMYNSGTIDPIPMPGSTLTFTAVSEVTNEDSGEIRGGSFSGEVYNFGTIGGGSFSNMVTNAESGKITGGSFSGDDFGVMRLENYGSISAADVANPPTFERPVNNRYDGVISGGAFNSMVNNGDGVAISGGEISGGTFNGAVYNYTGGKISGGNFNRSVTNDSAISGGDFTKAAVQNEKDGSITGGTFGDISGAETSAVAGSAQSPVTINGEIFDAGSFTGCSFGENARVHAEFSGYIDVAAQVNGTTVRLQYGQLVMDELGPASAGRVWARVTNTGNVRVATADTVTLRTETYVSVPEWTFVELCFDFDYFDEELIVSLPDGVKDIKGELAVVISYGTTSFVANNAFAEGDSFTVSLSDLGEALGMTLPGENGLAQTLAVCLSDGQTSGTAQSVTVPARPSYALSGGLVFSNGYNYAQLSAGSMGLLEEHELGLAAESDDLPSEPAHISDANGRISGLAEDTAYVVYTRLKATENSFCSAWHYNRAVRTFTQAVTHLTVSVAKPVYQWTPSTNLAYFNIRPVFSEVGGSGRWDFEDQYTLKITDADGNEVRYIRNAGEYTVTVKLDEKVGNYALDKDTFTITVNPIDLSTVQISLPAGAQAPTYTGQTAWPDVDSIAVAVNGSTYALSAANYWQFETASGKNDVNAGNACVLVRARSRQSNVVGSGELAYTISPQAATLAVNESGRAWSQGMSLDETALRALFTVNDAGNTPLDGSLYTIAVKQDGQTVTPPIVNAGAYTIEVTLTGDGENYNLNQSSFAYTISPVAFAGTMSMAGYVYGGTVSTPVLNGYAGDGEVTFYYRAKGAAQWTAWQNISATSLAPDDYELMARVADTTNYAGGETAAAEFTVSHATLGVAIEMSDYTYGGEVPTPALTPATEGLNVQWFYKGQDGVERAWQNITGTTLAAGGYTIIARIAQSALYEEAELTASFTVRKAPAPAIEWPTASGITYGQRVSEAKLSATADGHGTFAWAQPDAVLDAGAQSAALTYMPDDTQNYDYTGVALTKEIAISVSEKTLESSDISLSAIADQTYTGAAIEPEVVVKDGNRVLVEGTDYTVAYANNVNAGTATITITGMGNYTGTLRITFTIRAAATEEDETETLTPAQMAETLASDEPVEGLVTDRFGEAAGYETDTVEVVDEATGEVTERTLVIIAEPVRDKNGEILLNENGEPVYEQRNLNLSQALLEAIAELGYTHIRFNVKDAALEWAIADMTEDGNIIRLAPMEADELSQRELEAIGEAEQLSGAYRARITAMIDGEETDVTPQIPSLTAWFNAEVIRELTEEEAAQCLLAPGDETLEAMVSEAEYVEEGEEAEKKTSYQAALAASGLFVLILT